MPPSLNREDAARHQDVLWRAQGIYAEREAIRGGLWKEFGPEEDARHIVSKGRRAEVILAQLTHIEESGGDLVEATKDELLDIINYAAFAYRKLTGNA